MSTNHPEVSVIIPTHNRWASLQGTLRALALQTYPIRDFEVIVVADGCTDGTAEELQNYQTPLVLRIFEQSGHGAAAARNYGATKALGSLLLFLDDDVEPTASLIEKHVRAHTAQPRHAVMGPYLPVCQGQTDFFHVITRLWWHQKFETLQQAGHRYTFLDLLSGNLSIAADLFGTIGGFDTTIRSAGGEDHEFGARLIKAGVPFTFAPRALAYHHEYETMNLARVWQRARQEGRAEIEIGRRHPELRPLQKSTLSRFQIYPPWPLNIQRLAISWRHSWSMRLHSWGRFAFAVFGAVSSIVCASIGTCAVLRKKSEVDMHWLGFCSEDQLILIRVEMKLRLI